MFEGMFQDLLEANRGVKYFYLSTDEAYYVGLANTQPCDERAPKNSGAWASCWPSSSPRPPGGCMATAAK